MQAMRVALAFQRPDVDQLLSELDHEQFSEWAHFLTLEPQGWDAIRIAATRIAFVTALVQSRKRLHERDFEIKIGGTTHSPETEKARWEAMSIRCEIASENQDG